MADFQIFISYRRDGGEDLAGRISDKLKGMGYNVFYDIESMRSGVFDKQILDAIEQCQDVILILPPNSLDRCVDEADWVRQEIEHAIKHEKNIIPIMMRGFEFPSKLPESIDSVRYYEAVQASTVYFEASIQRIESLLKCNNDGKTTHHENEELIKGVRFINYRQYSQAKLCLNSALQFEPSNPDIYFYLAIATLEGKRPFLVPKSVINEIVESLKTAVSIEERGIYHYLLAYIKFDYHSKKMLRATPDYRQELATAKSLGVTQSDIDSLAELLNVDKSSFTL